MIFDRRSFISLILFATVVRAVVLWIGRADMLADPDSYSRLAVNWATTGTFGFEGEGGVSPTAFRPPLYPWLLSWFVRGGELPRSAVACLHLTLGCITVTLTYLIGCRLKLPLAWLAGVAVALDPILLRQSQLLMTETLATCLAVLAWWLWTVVWPSACETDRDGKRRSGQWLALVGFSLALGASVLARPTAAPWVLSCAIVALVVGCSRWRRRAGDFALICLLVIACLAPWTLRNWSAFGKPMWATTHGGYTLLLANNPPLYRHFAEHGPSRAWEAEEFQDLWAAWLTLEIPPLGEVAADQLAYQAARSTIARHPRMFIASCLYRVGWLWALWPHDGSFGAGEVLIAIWYATIFYFAYTSLQHLWRTRAFRGWLVGLLLVFSLTAIHTIYWSNMRMRAPAMPCVILLAAARRRKL